MHLKSEGGLNQYVAWCYKNLKYVLLLTNLLLGLLTDMEVCQRDTQKKENKKAIDLTFRILPPFFIVVFVPSYTTKGYNGPCHCRSQFEIKWHHSNLNVTFLVTLLSIHNWHWILDWMYIFIILCETLKDFDRYATLMGWQSNEEKNRTANQLSRCQLRFLSQTSA